MAFTAQTIRHRATRSRPHQKPLRFRTLLRRSAVPGATAAGVLLALASIFAPAPARHADALAVTHSTTAMPTYPTAAPATTARLKAAAPAITANAADKAKLARLAAPAAEKTARPAPLGRPAKVEDPFDKVVATAGITPDRVRVIVQNAYLVAGLQSAARNAPDAAPAIADPAIAAAQPESGQAIEGGVGVAALTPEIVPLPQSRPRLAETARPEKPGEAVATAKPEKPAVVAAVKPEKPEAGKPEKPGLFASLFRSSPENPDAPAKPDKRAKTIKPEKPQVAMTAMAFARPDSPDRGMAGAFNGLFNKPNKPGNRTAIYDISAGVVIMPNGERMEAHSGIGKMADNPNFVHVKMNGPTPPNTYKLSMREKRFHGVEAIRMTPIGDEPMHGRNGILAHSYLLRGRAGQSHGCVAFKDYDRFLKAFKAGHVTHIVVVPGNGARVRKQMVASNDV